jgi:hypothetical protein
MKYSVKVPNFPFVFFTGGEVFTMFILLIGVVVKGIHTYLF